MKIRAMGVKEVMGGFKKHSNEHCAAKTGKCLGYLAISSASSIIT